MSDLVTYTRPGFAPLTNLSATPGQTNFAIDEGDSVRLAAKERDWVITASDLVLGGKVVWPLKGDRITATSGAFAGTWEVQIPDGTDQPYKPDSTDQQIRIHTKRISA